MMRALLAAALVLAGLFAGCRQLANVETREACEGLAGPATACGSCVRSSCCSAALACRREPACAALDDCLGQCSGADERCRSKCRDAHPEGFGTAFAALASCTASACTPACGLACGGYVYPDEECATCGNGAGACCFEASACSTDSGCLALAFEARRCASHDHACRGEHERRHPQSVALSRALAECLAQSCPLLCSYAVTPWSCLLGETPAAPVAGVMHLEVTGGPDDTPVTGATVYLCDQSTLTCSSTHLFSGMTGGDGKLEVPYDATLAGYFLVEKEGYVSVIRRLVDIPSAAPSHDVKMNLFPTNDAALLDPLANPAMGLVFVRITDCDAQFAPGISFELDPMPASAIPFYGSFGAAPGTVTDVLGAGGFVNVPPGKYTLRAHRRVPRQCIRETTIVTQPGTYSVTGDLSPRACAL